MHGHGLCYKASGVVIEGNFFAGELHGTGTGRKVDGEVVIEGRYVAGRMKGRGTCTLKSGVKIELSYLDLDHLFCH